MKRRIKTLWFIAKVMVIEATRPIGTVFEQRIDGQWIRVSRVAHMRYMWRACRKVVRS